MISSSTSPYGLLNVFSIACGYQNNTVSRRCYINFCPRLYILTMFCG